ncbi:hypothetical protein Mycsm_07066 (plasmid) [Mycobacterium sp. JS623]|uniref:Uncharacterized protein n=1 Tax=Mycolicibacterium chlorophenolicum TaxID=37916 RepID=A0A0J6WLP1_9MYCO|nr:MULTISPECIES: hypothetical protein [Mycobacteriaceae]AGB27163.1 hypothetical protein Mycsm_07066 [Mycobacterium sp. JS623]KMO82642.1 hypothetical protein MCHLDSM_01265 [Mycolicibacterium chlorophenolicum]
MYPELEDIRASIAALEAVDAQQDSAFSEAVGIYSDDPVSPSVMALVWRGRLADLKIADEVCQLPPPTAAQLINAVLINAFNAWHMDYTRRALPPTVTAGPAF